MKKSHTWVHSETQLGKKRGKVRYLRNFPSAQAWQTPVTTETTHSGILPLKCPVSCGDQETLKKKKKKKKKKRLGIEKNLGEGMKLHDGLWDGAETTLHNLLWNNSYPAAEDLSPGPSGLCGFFPFFSHFAALAN